MTPIRFVIPAAGAAIRFGGVHKELLPISKSDCGLSHAVKLAHKLGGCPPVIVTTAAKYDSHAKVVQLSGREAKLVVKENPEDGDMWGSVLCGIDSAMNGGLIMPDTVPVIEYSLGDIGPLTFGCFATSTPWRFSCLDVRNGRRPVILTKPQVTAPMLAWGIVVWNTSVANKLRLFRGHYDRAFESIMETHNFGMFLMKEYSDIGTFEDYKRFMQRAVPYEPNREELLLPKT